jgi:hypothetical protein
MEICQMDEGTNGRSSGKREAGIGDELFASDDYKSDDEAVPIPFCLCHLPLPNPAHKPGRRKLSKQSNIAQNTTPRQTGPKQTQALQGFCCCRVG